MFTSLMTKLNPYVFWIKVAAIGLILSVVFYGGCSVGQWKQAVADSDKVTEAQNVITGQTKLKADAEEKGRAAAEAAYKDEIAALQAQNKQAADALDGYQHANAQLASQNDKYQQTIKGLRHDQANSNLLDTRIPDSIRNGVRDSRKAQP